MDKLRCPENAGKGRSQFSGEPSGWGWGVGSPGELTSGEQGSLKMGNSQRPHLQPWLYLKSPRKIFKKIPIPQPHSS